MTSTISRLTNLGDVQLPTGEVFECVVDQWIASALNHNTGTSMSDNLASTGIALVGQTGVSTDGALLTWGPYYTGCQLNRPYRLWYRIKVDSNTSASNVVELAVYNSYSGTSYMSARTILNGTSFTKPGVYQWFYVDFELPSGTTSNAEFYAWFHNAAGTNVYLDKYVLVDLSGNTTNYFDIDSLGNVFLGGEIEESMPVNNASIASVGTTNLVSGSNVEIGSFSPAASNCTIETVTHPQTGKQVKAIHFHKGYTGITQSSAQTPTLNLTSGASYSVAFDAWTLAQDVVMEQDFYPDSLPQQQVTITPTVQTFRWTTSSTDSNWSSCSMRFFNDTYNSSTGIPDDVYITYIQLENASSTSLWTPNTRPNNSLLLKSTLFENATNAFNINGVSSAGWISVPSNSAFVPSQFTFMGRYAWDGIQGASASSLDWAAFFTIPNYTGSYGALLSRLTGETNNTVNFYVNGSSLSYSYVEDTKEHHWAFVYNGTTAYIYRDGNVVATGNFPSPPNSAQPLYIGGNGGNGYPWGGTIRETSLWNVALTQTQIQTYMNQGSLHGNESGLVGYWRGTGSTNTVIDYSNNGNNGTINGSVIRVFI